MSRSGDQHRAMHPPRPSVWVFAGLVAIAGIAPAADPPDLLNLKAQYEIAMAQAARRHADAYKETLLQLQQQFRDANDNVGLAAASGELARLGITSASPARAPASNVFGAVGVGGEKYFVGKSWFSIARAEYRFHADGTGLRTYRDIKTPFTWRKLDDGLVEVAGRTAVSGPPVTWYFKFDNAETAVFGTKQDVLDAPLQIAR